MAELADALDSGSSESNFMEVQVLLPAPKLPYESAGALLITSSLFTLHLLRELWKVISNREERRSKVAFLPLVEKHFCFFELSQAYRQKVRTFVTRKLFTAPSALFSCFYMLNSCVCLKGGSSSVTFIKKKIATAAIFPKHTIPNRLILRKTPFSAVAILFQL